MVNKVLQANKRIAAKSAKQVIKPPPVISTTGFEIPSARKGKSLYDTLNAFKFKTGMDASEFLMQRGLPKIGTTGGDKSLELINKVVDPKDRYIKISPELKDLETQRYGTDNKKFKLNKIKLSKDLLSIQKEADSIFGKETTQQKIKFIEKAANKMGIALKYAVKMGFRNFMPFLGPAGVVLSIGMSKKVNAGEDEFFEQREADRTKQRLMKENNITQEQMNQIANQPMDLLAPINKRGGGMMNMDEIIRPLGYAHGGMHYEHGGFHKEEGKTFGQGEFHYDDPNLIRFIKKRADQNETTYQEELMKFVDEVEGFYRNKKNEVGKD